MLPAVLLGLFAVELLLCIVVGIHMLGSADAAMARRGEVALCIALYLLLARLAVVLGSFVYSTALNRAEPRLGPLRWLRMVGKEYAATLLAFSVLIPLSFALAPRLARKAAPGRTVVLLVHGLLSNRGVWWLFARRLRRDGLVIDSLDLKPTLGDMDRFVVQLARRIDRIAEAGAARILLVGHSMGGLACRACLVRPGANPRVALLITLASPHAGSRCAHYLPGANLRQMRPGSDWLRALAVAPRLPVPAVALYSAHDNLVVPYALGCCDALAAEQWLGLGHLGMLFDAKVHARVQQLIAECEARPAETAPSLALAA